MGWIVAWTQAEIDALKAAYAKGVLRVRYLGQETQFASGEDMLARIAMMEGELNTATIQRHRYASVSKGT